MHLDVEEEFMEEEIKDKVNPETESLFTPGFIAEIILLAFIPLPNWDMYITYSDSDPSTVDEV